MFTKQNNCANCVHSLPRETDDSLTCQLYPPAPILVSKDYNNHGSFTTYNYQYRQPTVEPHHLCSFHQPQPAAETER